MTHGSQPGAASARWLYGGGALVLVLAALLVGGLWLRHHLHVRRQAEALRRQVEAGPKVQVTTARMSPPERTVVLEGEARAYAEVTLYAKVSGYLREIRVDKGDSVVAGQILAVIDSPELDRQYQAGLADATNKRVVAKRAEVLRGPGVVSEQDADLAQAQWLSANENVKGLLTQKDYQIIRAPFAGTVTARYADPGALVQSATGAQTGALPVLGVAQIDRLRVFIYLPQADAAFVRVGDPVELTLPERPGQRFLAGVARISGELDPRTRMMLIEADMDNRQDRRRGIVPGSFVMAAIKVHSPSYVELPSEAIVLRQARTLVALVESGDRIHYQPVDVATDDGQTVRLLSGVKEGQRAALNVGDNVQEGGKVQPVSQPDNQAGQRAGGDGAGRSGSGPGEQQGRQQK